MTHFLKMCLQPSSSQSVYPKIFQYALKELLVQMILTFVKCGLTHFLNLQWKSQPWGKGKATIFTLGVFSNIKTGIWRHWKWLGRRAVRAASQLQFTSNQGEFFIPCLSTSGACGCQWLALCILSSQAAESTELRFSFACKRFIPWESGSPYSTLFFNVFFFFFSWNLKVIITTEKVLLGCSEWMKSL